MLINSHEVSRLDNNATDWREKRGGRSSCTNCQGSLTKHRIENRNSSANSSLTCHVSNPIAQLTQFLAQIPPKIVIVHYNLEHPHVLGILLEGSAKTVVILKLNFLLQYNHEHHEHQQHITVILSQ
jgi:hypothetical protein